MNIPVPPGLTHARAGSRRAGISVRRDRRPMAACRHHLASRDHRGVRAAAAERAGRVRLPLRMLGLSANAR